MGICIYVYISVESSSAVSAQPTGKPGTFAAVCAKVP